MTKCIKTFSCH